MKIETGNVIRLEDYAPVPGRPDCYVEGTVTKIKHGFVFINVTKDVWAGAETPNEITMSSRVGTEISAPIPSDSAVFFPSDWDGRLRVIAEK